MKRIASLLLAAAMTVSVAYASVVTASAAEEKTYLLQEVTSDDSNTSEFTAYGYDKNGNIVKETYGSITAGVKRVIATEESTYDAKNNCIKCTETYYSGDKSMSNTVTFEYDAANRMTKKSQGGDYTLYTYNQDGTLSKEEKYENNGKTPAKTICYTYQDGEVSQKLTKDSEGNDSKKSEFTTSGNVVTEMQYFKSGTEWMIDEKKTTTTTTMPTNSVTYATYKLNLGEEWEETESEVLTYNLLKQLISSEVKRSGELYETTQYTYSGYNYSSKVYTRYDDEQVEYTSTTAYTYGTAQEAIVLTMLNGAKQEWKPGSKTALSFRSEAPLGEFQKVTVDGNVVDKANYDLKEGSTIVSLHADYLQTLKEGTHEIGIVSTNGTAAVSFGVSNTADTKNNYVPAQESSTDTTADNKTDDTPKSPVTGDIADTALWVTLAVVSLLGTATLVCKKKSAE